MTDISIIINQKARNAHLANDYIEAFKKNNITIKLFRTTGALLSDTIDRAMALSTIILIGGGDGSVRTLAEKCVNANISIGVIPLGTLNHFAKELQLPTTSEEMIKALIANTTSQIDLGSVNEKIFVNNASIGFYAQLAKDRKYYSTFINKWLSYIPGFFTALKNCKKYHFLFKNKNSTKVINTVFLMVSNNLYSYKFPATFERESFTNNRLGLYFIADEKLSMRKFLNLFNAKNIKFTSLEASSSIHLESMRKLSIRVALDGDIFTLSSPLIFKSLPKSLKVLTIKK